MEQPAPGYQLASAPASRAVSRESSSQPKTLHHLGGGPAHFPLPVREAVGLPAAAARRCPQTGAPQGGQRARRRPQTGESLPHCTRSAPPAWSATPGRSPAHRSPNPLKGSSSHFHCAYWQPHEALLSPLPHMQNTAVPKRRGEKRAWRRRAATSTAAATSDGGHCNDVPSPSAAVTYIAAHVLEPHQACHMNQPRTSY